MKRNLIIGGAALIVATISAAAVAGAGPAPEQHHVTVATPAPMSYPGPVHVVAPPATSPPPAAAPTPTAAPSATVAPAPVAQPSPTTTTVPPAPVAPVAAAPVPVASTAPPLSETTGAADGTAGTDTVYVLKWTVLLTDGTVLDQAYIGSEAQADDSYEQMLPGVGQPITTGQYPAGAILQSLGQVTAQPETVTTGAG